MYVATQVQKWQSLWRLHLVYWTLQIVYRAARASWLPRNADMSRKYKRPNCQHTAWQWVHCQASSWSWSWCRTVEVCCHCMSLCSVSKACCQWAACLVICNDVLSNWEACCRVEGRDLVRRCGQVSVTEWCCDTVYTLLLLLLLLLLSEPWCDVVDPTLPAVVSWVGLWTEHWSSRDHHIQFWYLWCCGCPGLRGRQYPRLPDYQYYLTGLKTDDRFTNVDIQKFIDY